MADIVRPPGRHRRCGGASDGVDHKAHDEGVDAASPPPVAGALALWRSRDLRLIAGIYFFSNCIDIGIGTWLPYELSRVYHTRLVVLGFAASIPYIASLIVLNLAGYVLDKKTAGREWSMMALGATLMTGAVALMLVSTSLGVEIALWTLEVTSYSLIYATVFAIPLKLFPDEDIGTAAGIVNAGGQTASALTPAVLGLILAANGGDFAGALALLIAAGLCALGLAWRYRNRLPPLAPKQEAFS